VPQGQADIFASAVQLRPAHRFTGDALPALSTAEVICAEVNFSRAEPGRNLPCVIHFGYDTWKVKYVVPKMVRQSFAVLGLCVRYEFFSFWKNSILVEITLLLTQKAFKSSVSNVFVIELKGIVIIYTHQFIQKNRLKGAKPPLESPKK